MVSYNRQNGDTTTSSTIAHGNNEQDGDSGPEDQIAGFDPALRWDYENGFYLTSDITRIPKLLAHYELYRSIIDLPGHVVECGVFKGASLIRFLTFREILESPFSRKVIGFDAFGTFPQQERSDDRAFIREFESAAGIGLKADDLIRIFNDKGFQNYELVAGDILETVPAYLVQHPELRVALLHIDVDVYKPTLASLEHLYDRVVPGGLVVFDDYGIVAGETDAVDEFFATREQPIRLEKHRISHRPAFIRKPKSSEVVR